MEDSNVRTYDTEQEEIGSSDGINNLAHNKNKSAATTVHFKEEAMEYLNIGYPCQTDTQGNNKQNNRVKEQQGTDVVNTTSFITDEQLDPLGKKIGEHVKEGTSKSNGSIDDIENLIEKHLRTMEKNIASTIKKRIKRMGKKIMGLQKSMFSDLLFLYKEQPGISEANIISNDFMNQTMNQLPEIPVNTIEKFTDFEQRLKCDAKLQNNLISSFLTLNCTSPGEYIRICWSKILTDKVAANFSWTVASTKSSIYNRLITKTIKKAFALKFPMKLEKFNIVTQKYFQYAKERTTALELNSVHFKTGAPMTTTSSSTCPETNKVENLVIPSLGDVKTPSDLKTSHSTELTPELPQPLGTYLGSEESENQNLRFYKSGKKYGQVKKPPKTGAQRSREYRLRKKRSKTTSELKNQIQSNDSSTSLPFTEDMDTTNSEFLPETQPHEKSNEAPVTSTDPAELLQKKQDTPDRIVTKIDISEYGFCNQSDYGQSSQTNEDTSQEYSAILYDESFWKSPGKSNVQTTRKRQERKGTDAERVVPKTPAERSRAYRIRKRMKMAAALQRQQLENECLLNADPLSN